MGGKQQQRRSLAHALMPASLPCCHVHAHIRTHALMPASLPCHVQKKADATAATRETLGAALNMSYDLEVRSCSFEIGLHSIGRLRVSVRAHA